MMVLRTSQRIVNPNFLVSFVRVRFCKLGLSWALLTWESATVPIARVRIIWIALMALTAVLGVAGGALPAFAQDQTSGVGRSRSVEPYRPVRSGVQRAAAIRLYS